MSHEHTDDDPRSTDPKEGQGQVPSGPTHRLHGGTEVLPSSKRRSPVGRGRGRSLPRPRPEFRLSGRPEGRLRPGRSFVEGQDSGRQSPPRPVPRRLTRTHPQPTTGTSEVTRTGSFPRLTHESETSPLPPPEKSLCGSKVVSLPGPRGDEGSWSVVSSRGP